ncbi:MAG: TonB-dependent receptor [Acidobacteriota bacterium]|jgi:hypothetical protein|nr:TonB-dependent receptor [Acidobacteriota bacterium]NLT32852.1 TonB-dependent receptor [Acidobacteriota bacterium]
MTNRMVHVCLRSSVALFLCAVLSLGVLCAQGTRGTIGGSVHDQSEAVVPNATVKLVDRDKAMTVQTVTSNDNGDYRFLEVEPSVYEIIAVAPGFSETQMRNVKLEPNRSLVIPIKLSVAGMSQVITVSGAQILIETESATLGTTVENTRLEGLPLDGRNVLQLAYLQPGVAYSTSPTGGTFGQGLGMSVNGARGVENNVMLDGANNNEIAVGGSTGAQPRPDALQEFRILSSNFEAEFGRNSGSIINVVTKSGTNEYHGNARAFWRPTVLSSRKYFDEERRRYERKEIGGNFGGPVWFPGIYNGKNRTFFFVDYETRRQLIGDTKIVTGLPNQAEMQGDFSGLTDDWGDPVTLFDPATGDPFPGNVIPSDRISPIARYYLDFFPVGDETGSANVGADETTNNTYVTFRIDHQVSNRNMLSFSSNIYDSSVESPFAFNGADVPGFPAADKRRTTNYIVRDTHFFTPNVANSLLLAYARNNQPGVAPVNTDSPAKIGFTADFVVDPALAGPPFIWLFERDLFLGNSIQGPQTRVTENFQIQEGLSWTKGNHRFKFGFDGTKYRGDQLFMFVNQGILGFSSTYGGNSTGDDLADFMIGTSPAWQQYGSSGLRDFRQHIVSFFAQDTWKVTRGLTLNLGLRYEYSSPIVDKYDRMTFYRPGVTSELLTSGTLTQMDGTPIIVPEGGRAPNGLVYVGDPDPVLGGKVPRGGVNRDMNNWAPRFGLAYTPKASEGLLGRLFGDEKTVIRTGFGIYYGAIIGDTALQQLTATGFSKTDAYYEPGSGTLADPFAPDPYPNYGSGYYVGKPDLPQLPNPFADMTGPVAVKAPLEQFARPIDPQIRTPYTYQYNLTIERRLWDNYLMTLSYVGNRGVKLYAERQVNYAYGTFIPFPEGRDYIRPENNEININERRVNTDIMVGLDEFASIGYSNYNAFEAQVQKTYGGGITFQLAYTFSKSISDTDNSRDNLDVVNPRITRGLSSQDVPHRFVGSWVYQLPFAKNLSAPLRRFLDGWSVGGIVTFQSGTPFSVSNASSTADGTGGAVISYADLGAEYRQMDPRKNDGRAFNADAFASFSVADADLATDYRRGTSRRNQFRLNNGINNWDLIISKKTQLWNEASGLELRFEMFNAFNHAQFSSADLNIRNKARGSFGTFTNTSDARVIQLGARISF